MLRYWTAGESHGPALVALVDGFPAGLTVDIEAINVELQRRQGGHGRGGRQRIETDTVTFLSGLWRGVTLGSPLALEVINRDAKLERLEEVDRPRPGHADLAGSIKHLGGVRAVLERASARETAARVAAGGLARQLLAVFGIEVAGWVRELGGVVLGGPENGLENRTPAEWRSIRDSSAIYSLHPDRDPEVTRLIDTVGKEGDTLGGVVEVQVHGLPIGLGTHAQWDRKLDGRIGQAVIAVQAIKGVEIGMGFEAARRRGSEVHDAIRYDANERQTPSLGFDRPTNNAGGLEAGMTNGQPLVVKAAMKPISTLRKPLGSVNLRTKQAEEAAYERSDVCAVSACSVIIENVVAFEVAAALVDKFGGDSVEEMQARWRLFHDLAMKR
ncbi:MAG: chorismate synthase [Planctomycetia bacterium]